MDQQEQNQVAMREEFLTMRSQMGQLMETIQAMDRGQEELRHANLRVAAANPPVTLQVNTPVMTQRPPEGGPMNQNIGAAFNILVNGGDQPKIDDHHDAFFIPKDDSFYDTFGPSTAEVEKNLCALEENMKSIEGYSSFGLDTTDMCLVPGVKIPVKFKVPDFEKYKGVSCPRTHIRSYCRNIVSYSDDEKLLIHFF
ncbi:uncharacterized protein LOC127135895 [Lathyrus oleraceus]|uniref:uncharacterized protein LOC127135895 n=1 Tax=Pisum sativum TaxID=3888 RepID=UPI0021D388B0|nr:uncharacterized protein LOC127135895 [Pisum sativum]